jgi:hypothetical protein
MYQNLENYLLEISHYLAVKDGTEDILVEIKSHILEKTEAEFETITEDGISKIISGYGKPQQVAAKYLEGFEIISPTFKRHLFLYTGILFACHLALTLIAFLFHFDIVGLPFLYIPNMDIWQFVYYVPMAFIYDLGLVGLVLYFVTQKKKDASLPWPKLLAKVESVKEMKKPKIFFMALLVVIFIFFISLFVRFGTVFFASMNDPGNPVPLFGPSASLYYSLLFLAIIGCEVIAYATRFITQTRWPDLIKNSTILILLQFVWNSPVKADFAKIPGVDLNTIAMTFVFIVTIVVVFKFIKNLILVVTKQFTNRR